MEKPLSALAVANWFITTALEEGEGLTAMKLQKLIFFAHGWCLALFDSPLVDDQPEAWQYGPVFPDVYHAAKKYGSAAIEAVLLDPYFSEAYSVPASHPRKPLLERVWRVYGRFSAFQLSNMTHEEGGPWHQTRSDNPGRKGTDIDEKLLKKYFREKRSNEN